MLSFLTLRRSGLRAGFLLAAALAFTACDSGGGGGEPGAPNANAGPDQSVEVGTRVTLNAASSTDPDGDALTYTWAFQTRPSGSSVNLSSSTGSTVTFTPDVEGGYVARVTVSDGMNTDTDDVAIMATQSACIDFDENVSSNRTLDAGRYCVPAGTTIRVSNALLTLSPGVRIDFGAGAGLDINNDGALISQGTAGQPVSLQGLQPTAGYWKGVVIRSNDVRNALAFTTVAHGGSSRYAGLEEAANVGLDNDTRLSLTNSIVRDGISYGLSLDPGATTPTFSSNTFSDNAEAGVRLDLAAATRLDGASAYAANTRAFVDVSASVLTDDGALAFLDVPYRFSGTSRVSGGVLALEAGARLVFAAGAALEMNSDGALSSNGTPEAPVSLVGEQATPGSWSGVVIRSNDARNRLSYTTVAHGGGARFAGLQDAATVALDNNARLVLEFSTVRDGLAYGLALDSGAQLPSFTSNTFSGNAESGVLLDISAATQLDGGSAYADNTDGFVDIYASTLSASATLTSLDAPYRISGEPRVEDGLLTVAAGARITFSANAGLQINLNGALSALGTASSTIAFQGEQPTRGFWKGIAIRSNDTRNRLDRVTISGGGGARYSGLGEAANLAVDNNAQLSVSNSTIRDSAGWGIQADAGVVLVQLGNTFANNASGNVNQD